MRSQEEPGGARRSQKEPGGAKRRWEEAVAAWSAYVLPGDLSSSYKPIICLYCRSSQELQVTPSSF